MSEPDATSKTLEASAVSVKIPPFWVDKPEMWFFQVEAQFQICNIVTEDTKFNYLVAQLEPRFIENIWDIIKDSTNKTKYSSAKDRLLATFTESENKKIKRLLTGLELGDMTPSQLLRKMRSLGGNDVVSDKVLRTLWLDKMPDSVKNILIVSDESLEKLAEMADKIMEMSPRTAEVAAIQQKPALIEELISKISALEHQIASMSVQRNPRRSDRTYQQRSRSRSKSRGRYDPKGKFCFYHFKFGSKCLPEKCVQPCNWKLSENQSLQ